MPHLRRRDFLRLAAITVAVSAAPKLSGCSDASGSGGSSPEDVDRVFPQGLASGDPRPDSVVLWTRVATADAATTVGYLVALDEGFSQVVAEGEVATDARARPHRQDQAARPRSVHDLLLPLHGARRDLDDRPHQDGAGAGRRRAGALRVRVVPGLRRPLLPRVAGVPRAGRRGRLRRAPRRLHLRDHRRPRLPDAGRDAPGRDPRRPAARRVDDREPRRADARRLPRALHRPTAATST